MNYFNTNMREFMRKNIYLKLSLLWLILVLFNSSLPAQNTQQIPLPDPTPVEDELRFAAVGDTGTGSSGQYDVARQMLQTQMQTNYELLLFLGDNIYPSGSPKGFEKRFIEPYSPLLLRGVEFRGAIGNHDERNQNGVYLQQMVFGMGSKTYHSFSKNDELVEFFCIDSTLLNDDKDPQEKSDQLKWLEKALSESKARWKIAYLHHPIYSSAKKHGHLGSDEDEHLAVRAALEPLYVKYGLDISINGHDHVYERTKPQKGIQYFTSGAGAKLREHDLQTDTPFYAFGKDNVRSFMLFSVTTDVIQFWSIDEFGNVIDSGEIFEDIDKKNKIKVKAAPEKN